MDTLINDVVVTPLKKIKGEKGSVYHALKQSEKSFTQFGEAYFSSVDYNIVKGWKKHTKMICNLIVPVGAVEFVIYDDRNNSSTKGNIFKVNLSQDNYFRLTIPANLWFAFKGNSPNLNLILNIANIEHEPNECESISVEEFTNYKF